MNFLKPKFWKTKNNLYSISLLPVTFIIIFLNFLRRKFIKPKKFNIPVICIGNIYIGGTGKTPLSILLANELKKIGRNPVIIKKFYKDQIDEQDLIKKKTGQIISDKNRSSAIRLAEQRFDLAILDDGFQDHKIKKDLNILCFNSEQLIGNGYTIPSGPLRESVKQICRSQIIVINGENSPKFENEIFKFNKTAKIFYSKYILQNLEKFKNKDILAIAGIGNPENFFNLLKKNGLKLKETIIYPDHYSFNQNEISGLVNKAKKNKCIVVTTEKDFMRLQKLKFENIYSCNVGLELTNKESFLNLVNKMYD